MANHSGVGRTWSSFVMCRNSSILIIVHDLGVYINVSKCFNSGKQCVNKIYILNKYISV